MNKVLVTGASSFLGRQCLPALVERGYEVHATSRHSIDGPKDVSWHLMDLHDPERVASLMADVRPSHLLHCAWYEDPRLRVTSPENLSWVSSSLRLAKEFVTAGGQRIVGVGSSFEYDLRYGYCSEALTPLSPETLYGAAKRALGALLESYATQEKISLAWARVFFLYGPHEHPDRLVSSIVRKLLLGERAQTSHGRQIRDYLHTADAGGAIVALLDAKSTGPVNIGSGRPISLREIVQEIGRQIGREELLEFGSYSPRPDDAPFIVADVTRLSAEIGWQPKFDLPEGLANTITWWNEELRSRGELDESTDPVSSTVEISP